MTNQRMAGDAMQAASQSVNQELMAQQQKIRAVMERQTARDVAAAQGRIIPFSQADVLKI